MALGGDRDVHRAQERRQVVVTDEPGHAQRDPVPRGRVDELIEQLVVVVAGPSNGPHLDRDVEP